MNSIGSKIKKRRKELGLTQAGLAEPEFTPGFISQIENGITKPPLKSLEVIAAKLAVSVSFLIDDENEPSVNLVNQHKVLEQFQICKRLIHLKKYKDAYSIIESIEKVTNKDFYGQVLELKGSIAYEQELYKDAIPLLDEAIIYLNSDPLAFAEVYLKLADCYMKTGEFDKAIDSGSYGLSIFKKANKEDNLTELKLLYILAYCHCRRKEYKQGLRFIEEAISISDITKIYYNYGSLKMLKGLSYTYLKEYVEGIRFTKEALLFFESSGSFVEIVGCLTNLGILYRYLDEWDQSIYYLQKSLVKAKEDNLEMYIQNDLYELATTFHVSGRNEEALAYAEEGLLAIREESLRGKILYTLGSTHSSLKNWAEAVTYLRQSLKVFEKSEMSRWRAKTYSKLAEVFHQQGEFEYSHTYYKEAIEIFDSLMDAE